MDKETSSESKGREIKNYYGSSKVKIVAIIFARGQSLWSV